MMSSLAICSILAHLEWPLEIEAHSSCFIVTHRRVSIWSTTDRYIIYLSSQKYGNQRKLLSIWRMWNIARFDRGDFIWTELMPVFKTTPATLNESSWSFALIVRYGGQDGKVRTFQDTSDSSTDDSEVRIWHIWNDRSLIIGISFELSVGHCQINRETFDYVPRLEILFEQWFWITNALAARFSTLKCIYNYERR